MLNSSLAVVDVHPSVEVILTSTEVCLPGDELSSPLDSFLSCRVARSWLSDNFLVNVMGLLATLLPRHVVWSNQKLIIVTRELTSPVRRIACE